MPKAAKKPVPAKAKPPAPPPPAAVASAERNVLYPDLYVSGILIPRENLRIDCAKAKIILEWEDEDEYRAAHPGADQQKPFGTGEFLLTDVRKKKVQCWNSTRNRPFDEPHARKLAQDILNRRWKFNGESMVVGKTALALSGNHTLIGLVLACQEWADGEHADHWKELWSEEPWIEKLITFGVDEDQETISTIDNVKPRSAADTFYTSEIFRDLTPGHKRECAKMLEKAVAFLWARAGGVSHYNKYATNSEQMAMVETHPKLLECIHYIFTENSPAGGRVISRLGGGFSPGQAAGMLYLMGSSGSDGEKYREQEPQTENGLNWKNFTKAKALWAEIVQGKSATAKAVVYELAKLKDPETTSTSSREIEKHCVLAKAWRAWAGSPAGQERVKPTEVALEYITDDAGNRFVKDIKECTFGGIDKGPKPPAKPPVAKVKEPTPEEVEKAKEAARIQRAKDDAARIAAKKAADKASGPQQKTGKAIPGTAKATTTAPKPAATAANGKPAAKPATAKKAAPIVPPPPPPVDDVENDEPTLEEEIAELDEVEG